jgi:MFS family permease
MFLASRVLVGFAASCLLTACVSTIAATYDGNARAKAMGVAAAMGSIAAVFGYVAGGALAQAAGWRATFIQFPIFALLELGLAFAGIRDVGITAKPNATITEHESSELWPLYLLTVIITTIMFMGSTQFIFLLPKDGIRTATGISLVLSTKTVVSTIVSFSFCWTEKRLGLQGALVAGLTSCAIGLTLIGAVANPMAAVLGATFLGGYVGNVMPYIYQAVTVKTPAASRARAIGRLTVFNFTGALINPIIFAPLGLLFGLHHLFLIIGIFMGLLAAGTALRTVKKWPNSILRKHKAAT